MFEKLLNGEVNTFLNFYFILNCCSFKTGHCTFVLNFRRSFVQQWMLTLGCVLYVCLIGVVTKNHELFFDILMALSF